MLPTPNHLKTIFVPDEECKHNDILAGMLQCPCGCTEHRLMYPGQTHEYRGATRPCTAEVHGEFFFIVKAVCEECKAEHLVFDKHFHGWDGLMCHDERESQLPRPPLVPWECLSCHSLSHEILIRIALVPKDDFIEQSYGEFGEERWPDAFEWIWISIECCRCGLKTEDWVDYETM